MIPWWRDRRGYRAATGLAIAALAAACAPRGPALVSVSVTPPPAPAIAALPDRMAELAAIEALLDRGDAAAATPRLAALLRRDPADRDARLLMRSIQDDPARLLGARSVAYVVRPGETLASLAQRVLGSRLKAYALARYNRIAIPASVTPGSVLRMPAAPRPLDAGIRPPRRVRAPRPASPARTPGDPVAAQQARAAGLAALGQGRLAVALAALRRAAALLPGDPLIRRDLARVEALAAVRAKR